MTLAELSRRLEQVENALADAQARLPGVRAEVHAIRRAVAEVKAPREASGATAA